MRLGRIRKRGAILTITLSFFLCLNCQSNTNQAVTMEIPDTLQNRQPAVAGQFYPSDSSELQRTLKKLFAKAPDSDANSEVRAIISPHAGYVFSGEVAAAAFNQLYPEKEYKTIFVIGSSHRNSFAGGSVYSIGNYITPLGTVKTDFETAQKLVAGNKVLAFDPNYHRAEHSIEVQIPFLQYYREKDFKIVAILLGTQNKETCRQVAAALKPYFSPENLFVISTDFSHYPAYADAVKTDKKMADAIATNDPAYFIQALDSCTEMKVVNLSTPCCSWPCVLTLMYLTEDKDYIVYKQLMYKNSGDSEYGEKGRVVGYYALSVVQKKQDTMLLTDIEKKELLELARNAIQSCLEEKDLPEMDVKSLPPALCVKAGAFVTLKKQGQLRGCIGHFDADKPLFKIVQHMAVAAATRDSRFSAVTAKEMNLIDIEISVLTPLQKIQNVNQIRLGTDGIYIKKGFRSGTFLPQVATDTGWNLGEFLGHCARDKAGIGWDGWKGEDAEIFVYQAIVFGENE